MSFEMVEEDERFSIMKIFLVLYWTATSTSILGRNRFCAWREGTTDTVLDGCLRQRLSISRQSGP